LPYVTARSALYSRFGQTCKKKYKKKIDYG
jgi:hypothetical protein